MATTSTRTRSFVRSLTLSLPVVVALTATLPVQPAAAQPAVATSATRPVGPPGGLRYRPRALTPAAARQMANQLRGPVTLESFLATFGTVENYLGQLETALSIVDDNGPLNQAAGGARLALKNGGLNLGNAEFAQQQRTIDQTPGLRQGLRAMLDQTAESDDPEPAAPAPLMAKPGVAEAPLIVGLEATEALKLADTEKLMSRVASELEADIPACTTPFAASSTDSEACVKFDLIVKIKYLSCAWMKGCKWKTKKVKVATFKFCAGCEVEAKVDCCGGRVSASCFGEACVNGACARCSGAIETGLGVSTLSGGSCSYGANLVARVSCDIAGTTVFSAAVPISPYSVTAPCPVPGLCSR